MNMDGVLEECFPTWKQMAVTGNPERKKTGFGVTDLGSDPDKLLLCPNSPIVPRE